MYTGKNAMESRGIVMNMATILIIIMKMAMISIIFSRLMNMIYHETRDGHDQDTRDRDRDQHSSVGDGHAHERHQQDNARVDDTHSSGGQLDGKEAMCVYVCMYVYVYT